MPRPASFDLEIIELYPKLQSWYVKKFRRDPDEDTISEAITRALELYYQYDPKKCQLATWVTAILINVELARYRYYLQRHPADRIGGDFTHEMPNNFDLEVIENAFEELTPCTKNLLKLVAFGYKNRELAELYNNKPSTMKSRVCLARRVFREKLEEAGYPIY